jgi:two-component system nitrate/nitrite sensor histidine kinase NarX
VSLKRLQWLAIVLPIGFLAFVQIMTMVLLEPILGDSTGHWAAGGVLAVGVVAFSPVVFKIVSGMNRRIERQNKDLAALNAVSRAVSGTLNMRDAVNRAMDSLIEVTGAGAARIFVEGEAPDEPELDLWVGTPAAVDRLRSLRDEHDLGVNGTIGSAGKAEDDGRGQTNAARPHGPAPAIVASMPLNVQNRAFGSITLLADDESRLTHEGTEHLLGAVGNQIALAVQAGRLFRNVVRRARDAQALYDIGLGIAALKDTQKILASIVEGASEMLGAEAAALCLSQPKSAERVLASRCGPPDAFVQADINGASRLALLSDPSPGAGRQGPPPPCKVLSPEFRACHHSVPLRVGSEEIGELCVSSRTPRAFTERQRQLLAGLADMAAIAVNNARLLEREHHVAVMDERHRLAREMHDSLAQALGFLHLKAQVARKCLVGEDAVKAHQELTSVIALAQEAYTDVREAILGLSENVSPDTGVVGSLREYLRKFSRQTDIKADLQLSSDQVPVLSPDVEVQLLRVIQEAMTNIRKHANSEHAWVRISKRDNRIAVTVRDDGRGFDPDRVLGQDGSQFGVQVMRERVERVGGTFSIESSPGHGTEVGILLPASEEQNYEPDEDSLGG